MNEKNDSQEALEQKKRDRIALVVSMLFVLTISLLGYRFFNKSENVKTALYNVTNSREDTANNEGDIMAAQTKRDQEVEEQVNVEEKMAEEKGTETMQQGDTAGTTTNTVQTWEANDYKQGDIEAGGTYTVKDGDTLWEIAEAVYGNGAQWTQILNANSNDIGQLPGGQQSLIFVGQTLVIPSIS